MKKSRYTAEQIAFALRQAEESNSVPCIPWLRSHRPRALYSSRRSGPCPASSCLAGSRTQLRIRGWTEILPTIRTTEVSVLPAVTALFGARALR